LALEATPSENFSKKLEYYDTRRSKMSNVINESASNSNNRSAEWDLDDYIEGGVYCLGCLQFRDINRAYIEYLPMVNSNLLGLGGDYNLRTIRDCGVCRLRAAIPENMGT
jgi:hypothetical protein